MEPSIDTDWSTVVKSRQRYGHGSMHLRHKWSAEMSLDAYVVDAKTYGAAANGRPTRKTMIIRLINLATRTTSRTRGRQHLDSILLGPDTTYRSELIDASFFEPDPSC